MDFNDLEETRKWEVVDLMSLPGYDPVPAGRRRRRSARRRKIRIRRVVGLLLALFFFLGLVAFGFRLAGGQIRGSLPGITPLAAASEKVVPVLLLGIDRRIPEEPARSDTIILAFLNRQDKSISLLSIPRDTYAYLPDCSREDKINAAHALGGPSATAEAVSMLLGVDVEYYVVTDFQGFERIIDTLGGVTIDVDQGMYYGAEGIHIDPGVQRLNGHDALGFVRFRNYPLGDIDRIKHQQVFFQALADEVMRVRNIWKLPELVKEVAAAVDTNLTTTQLLDLATVFGDIDRSQVEGYILPGYPQYMKGISYWMPRQEEIEPLVDALSAGEVPGQADEDGLTDTVQDGNGE